MRKRLKVRSTEYEYNKSWLCGPQSVDRAAYTNEVCRHTPIESLFLDFFAVHFLPWHLQSPGHGHMEAGVSDNKVAFPKAFILKLVTFNEVILGDARCSRAELRNSTRISTICRRSFH